MHRRVRLLVLASAVLAASLAVGTLGARAQVPLPEESTTTTSSTTTSTTRPPVTSPSTTPTTAPSTTQPTQPQPPPPSPSTTAPVDGGGEGGDDHDHAAPVPSEYQSLVAQLKRSSANSSRKLLDALAPLKDLGVTEADAIALGFGRFPVGGPATFVDDWWFPRSSPPFHLHQGTDIFAPTGTPVRSPANGVLTRSNGGLGGLSAKVTEPDGTYYYLAHLSAVPPEQVDGQQVKIGDVIGYVGDSGNAAGGAPHLHFEIHMAPAKNPFLYPPAPPAPPAAKPGKGKKQARPAKPAAAPKPQPVIIGNLADPALYGRGSLPANNPKPFLDQWLNEAIANVPALIATLEAGRPRAIVATGLTRRFTDGGGFSAPAIPPRSQLLWASSANPSGGALQLAEAEASAVAGGLDWSLLAKREEARALAERERELWLDAMLDPLTPSALRPLL